METRRLTRILWLICLLTLPICALTQQQAAPVAPLDQPGHIFTVTMLKIEPSRVSKSLIFGRKNLSHWRRTFPRF